MLAMYLSRLHNKEALYETIGRIKQEPLACVCLVYHKI